MTENIVTGKKYRVLADAANKVWNRISIWSKASDTEFNDGKTAETKLGAINGITSDVNCEDETVAASAAMVNQLNSNLDNFTLKSMSGIITTKTPFTFSMSKPSQYAMIFVGSGFWFVNTTRNGINCSSNVIKTDSAITVTVSNLNVTIKSTTDKAYAVFFLN